jgi:hypothetical protein
MARRREKSLFLKGKAATDLDLLREHYFSQAPLIKRLEEKRDRFTEIHGLIVNGYRRSDVVKLLQTKYGYASSTAHLYLNETCELYGDISKVSKDAERAVLREQYDRLLQRAIEQGNLQLQKEILDSKVRLFGLAKEDAIGFNIEQMLMPVQVNFSSNPKLLKKDE